MKKRIILFLVSLVLGFVALSVACGDDFKQDLNAANADSGKTVRPLIVVVSSDRCHACVLLKETLKQVETKTFNLVVLDIQSPTGSKIATPKSVIPQVHRWVWNGKVWVKTVYYGYLPPDKFKLFAEGKLTPPPPRLFQRWF